jgi:calcium-dependent protein kinase
LLGKGGFGSVWKGKHRQNGNVVAIKYMSLTEYSKSLCITKVKSADMTEEIYREAKMLKGLDHKNIVHLEGAYVVKDEIIMIMEYCEGGELSQLVEQREGITELEARSIVK